MTADPSSTPSGGAESAVAPPSAVLPSASRARLRIAVGAGLVLVLVAFGVAVLVGLLSPRGATTVLAPGERQGDSATIGPDDPDDPGDPGGAGDDPSAPAGVLYVHILGEVARPGIYALHPGDRVVDAVAAAGGLTPTADPAAVNLARALVDGEQIVVVAVGAAPPPASGGGVGSGAAGGLVNLNTADAELLDTLPRVGPATAARIIAWREEHGPFTTVEDLLAVSGIGEATLDGLRELVTV